MNGLVRTLLPWGVLLAGLCCSAQQPATLRSDGPASWAFPFTVRGRCPDPLLLTYGLDPAGGPLVGEDFRRAIAQPLEVWSRTGVVAFRPAPPGQAPDVLFAWRRGAHDACPSFGRDLSTAHSGPVAPGTFVHFDASRAWSADGRTGESLPQAALHEIGHVLGLGHSPDPGALLFPDTSATTPAEADLAGLHSLYGGLDDGPGDVHILSGARTANGAPASSLPTLRRVAPAGLTDVILFDTDGDGDHELLVWRTDRLGAGALMVFHFAPGPVLARTVGPLLGAVPVDGRTTFHLAPDGGRWIVSRLDEGHLRVRGFDDQGWLREPTPAELLEMEGQRDALLQRPSGANELRGDLDGDGIAELVVRAN